MKKCILIFVIALTSALAAQAAPLIEESEAQLPDIKALNLKTRSITRGPGIKLVSPEPTAILKSPFTLKVAFEPRGGAAVDLSSIRVTYLKSPSVDLLDRVRPGLSERGIELVAAEAPAGEHLIQVSVQDSEGRASNSVIKLNVTK